MKRQMSDIRSFLIVREQPPLRKFNNQILNQTPL